MVRYFDSQGQTTIYLDALSNRTLFVFDGQKRLVSRTEPEGNSQQFAYDAQHNLTATTTYPKPGFHQRPGRPRYSYEPVFNQCTSGR